MVSGRGKRGGNTRSMLTLAALFASVGFPVYEPEGLHNAHISRSRHVCALPGCGVETERDYCCAEHCREHKARHKGGK